MNEPTYFLVPGSLSVADAKAMQHALLEKGVNAIVLNDKVKIIKPENGRSSIPALKAICVYCAKANINSSLECRGCGASLIE